MFVVFYQQPHLTLCYDETRCMGKSIWNGFTSGMEFRESVLAILHLMEEKEVRFWLSDQREMKAIRLKDQDWINEEIVPQLARTSLEKMAIIASHDMFNRIAVEEMAKKAAGLIYFDYSYFNALPAAEIWLNRYLTNNSTSNSSYS
jgi:hypothetical protein